MSSTEASSEHDLNTLRGVTFFWAVALAAMIPIVAVLALSDSVSDFVISEIDSIALGTSNAIGLIAVSGINAIGVISLGMVNSIGVISIGGVNSIGVVSIGGVNSLGMISIGGFNSTRLFWGLWAITIFEWSPRFHYRSSGSS